MLFARRRGGRGRDAPDARRTSRGVHEIPLGRAQLRPPPNSPAPTGQPILSVRDVTAAYGTVNVLEDVSFDIHAGRHRGRGGGESGSGKSTTARVITGLLPPKAGEVLFEGSPLPPALKGSQRASSCGRSR